MLFVLESSKQDFVFERTAYHSNPPILNLDAISGSRKLGLPNTRLSSGLHQDEDFSGKGSLPPILLTPTEWFSIYDHKVNLLELNPP